MQLKNRKNRQKCQRCGEWMPHATVRVEEWAEFGCAYLCIDCSSELAHPVMPRNIGLIEQLDSVYHGSSLQ